MRIPNVRLASLLAFLASVQLVSGCGLTDGRFLSPEGCRDRTQVDAVLQVDPSDDRWIWAVDRATGVEISLRLPGGYGVQPAPPAIVDPQMRVIGRTGDRVKSGCRDLIQDALMVDELDIVPTT